MTHIFKIFAITENVNIWKSTFFNDISNIDFWTIGIYHFGFTLTEIPVTFYIYFLVFLGIFEAF